MLKTNSKRIEKKNNFLLVSFFIIFFLITFLFSQLTSSKKSSSFKTKAAEEELCPDGGIWQGNGCDYGKYDANMQPTLNQCLIDSGVERCWEKCIKTYYSEQSRRPEGGYGPCRYVNANVCRRADRFGGCAGVCNYECCVGLSEEIPGEVYDAQNPPGSSQGQCRGLHQPSTSQSSQEESFPQQPPSPIPTSIPTIDLTFPSPTFFPSPTPIDSLPPPITDKPVIKNLLFTFKTENCQKQPLLLGIFLYDEEGNLVGEKQGSWTNNQTISLEYITSRTQILPYFVVEKNGYFSFWGEKIYPKSLSNTTINFNCQDF